MDRMLNVSSMQRIMHILKSSLDHGTQFTIWQTNKEERTKSQVKITKIDSSKKEIVFTFLIETRYFEFEEKSHIFAHGQDYNILIKFYLKKIDKGAITVTFPQKLKILELRNNKRMGFEKDNIPLKFKIISSHRIHSDNSEVQKGILQNLSSTGCLIRFLNSQFDDIETGDEIKILSIASQSLDNLEGTIRHSTSLGKMGGVEIIQFGVQFKKEIRKLEVLLEILHEYRS